MKDLSAYFDRKSELEKTFSQSASMSFNRNIVSEENFSFLNVNLSFRNSFNNIATATQFISKDTVING